MFGEENKFALGVIDGSLEGGEGDMLREVERFLRATFFVGCERGGFTLPRVRYFLVGEA